jgi:hypothetical protein
MLRVILLRVLKRFKPRIDDEITNTLLFKTKSAKNGRKEV